MKRSIIVMFLISMTLINCKKNATDKKNILIDGSSTLYPLAEAIAEEYRKVNSNIDISIGISGTGGGFKRFINNELDISNASRKIKTTEEEKCKEKGITFTELIVGYDGLSVIVNKQNDWIENITLEELNLIWKPESQNKIKKWNDVNSKWPNEEIHLFGPGTASGTFDFFTEKVIGTSGKSRGDFTASEDDNVLVKGVSLDKYALGFFGLAYYNENKDKLKLLSINNIFPDINTVKNGNYPLSRPLLIYVNNNSLKKEEVKDFIKFFLNNSIKVIGDVGYIALELNEYESQIPKIE